MLMRAGGCVGVCWCRCLWASENRMVCRYVCVCVGERVCRCE